MPKITPQLSFIVINLLFAMDAFWQIWAVATNHSEQTLIAKFLLCFTLFHLLSLQLGQRLPRTVLMAILFCLVGDVLLQPLDMNYMDLTGMRPASFVLGVISFCFAYGNLARYYVQINPQWRSSIKAKPATAWMNGTITVGVLVWMTLHNQAPVYLLLVLWLYSPIVIAAATLAMYLREKTSQLVYLALIIGSNCLVFSDTVIGLTVFNKIAFPIVGNPVWIISSYILGIFLIFNAIVSIEKPTKS